MASQPLSPYPDQTHGIPHTVLTGMLQVLGREERSLASLLDELCGVHKQKQHQRADWRQRCVSTRLLCPPPVQHWRSLGTPPHIRDGRAEACKPFCERVAACLAIMEGQTCAFRSRNVPCRPLPAELLQYAQADVHYLRFLAGQLGAMLAAKGPGRLQEARKRSLEMCLALYSKPASEVRTTHTNPQGGFRCIRHQMHVPCSTRMHCGNGSATPRPCGLS